MMARKLTSPMAMRRLAPPRELIERPSVPFLRWLVVTFLLAVAIPTLVAAWYLAAIKTPVYLSEARVAVRASADEPTISANGALSSLIAQAGVSSGGGNTSDLYAIQSFLLSPDAIAAVGGRERQAALFGGASVDRISRLPPDATVEEALIFWRRMVNTYVDSTAGILVLQVRGFSAETSAGLASDLVAASEQFLNDISRRGREVALADSRETLDKAATDMAAARARLLDFQVQSGILDPETTVRSVAELIGKLRLSKMELESLIDVGEITGTNQPTRRAERETQISVLEEQIATLEGELAGSGDAQSVARQLRDYEALKVDEEFTTELYRLSRSSYEKTRRQLEDQQRFVVQIVRPILPDSSAEPTIIASSLTLFAALFVIWGIVMLVIGAIRDW